MYEPYEPEVNDYVIWTTQLGMVHEGWVYWKGDPIEPKKGWPTPTDYITIEIGTKEREVCEYTADKPIKHKKHHVCLLCYKHQWNELKFVSLILQNYKIEKNLFLHYRLMSKLARAPNTRF